MTPGTACEPTFAATSTAPAGPVFASDRKHVSGGDGENRTLKCAVQGRQFPVSLRPRVFV